MNKGNGRRVIHMTGGTYIERQEITVSNGGVLNFGEPKKKTSVDDADAAIVEELAPIFYGNREEVAAYLGRIKGADATQVVQVTNEYIQAQKISARSCNKPLWEIHHKHGLYAKTLTNWNNQIKAPKHRN